MSHRLVVMIYDVADDRRRSKLHAILKQYGVSVQQSAFEARLTPSECNRVLERVGDLLDSTTDRYVMYVVPPGHEEQIRVVGVPRPALQTKRYFVV